jgi:hypothetical protein
LTLQRKEVKTMKYEKPEVVVLGDASRMIQAHKQDVSGNEGPKNEIGGVYDTEE